MLVVAHGPVSGYTAKNGPAKDDSYTAVRTRHPTDRGGTPQQREDTIIERRTRANSAGGGRINVYHRHPNPVVANPNINTDTDKGAADYGSRRAVHGSSSRSESDDSTSSSSPFKRFALLQRSFNKNSNNNGCSMDDQPSLMSPDPKSPARAHHQHHGSPLNNFFDLFRHRSNSDGNSSAKRAAKKGRCTAVSPTMAISDNSDSTMTAKDESDLHITSHHKTPIRRLEPLFVEVDRYRSTAYEDGRSLDQRRLLMSSTRSGLNDRLSPLDEKELSPVMRKRSNSDNSTFFVLRKTSRPGGAEVLGTLNTSTAKDDTYAQLLKTFACYHLMPHQSAVLAFDASIKTRQAFCALVDSGVRAALYWDCNLHKAVGMVTVTDLLYAASSRRRNETSSTLDAPLAARLSECDCSSDGSSPVSYANYQRAHSRLCVPKRPWSFISIDSDADLLAAVKVLQLNNIHRLPVIDEESGNVMYFLTAKKILHFMYRQTCASSLPLPARMYITLDQFPVGETADNGANFATVNGGTSLQAAVELFLENSSPHLPVINNESGAVENVFTKVDVMNYVADFGWVDFSTTTVAEVLAARTNDMEQLVACHKKTPLVLAVDRLVRENAHRIIVVDSNSCLWSIISVGSLLSYLAS